MNLKRLAASILFAFITGTVIDILLNAIILRSAFESAASFWRPAEELNQLVLFGWLSVLLTMICFGCLFARAGLRGIHQGLEFGLWLALASVFGVAGIATLVPWPTELLFVMAVKQEMSNLVLGISLGWLYQP